MSEISAGIARINDITCGHDSCKSVPITKNVSNNVFTDSRAVALKKSTTEKHGCKHHNAHAEEVIQTSSKVFANGRGIALKNSKCSVKDSIKTASNTVFAVF